MESITIEQATDILQATLEDVKKNSCPLTYLYSSYKLFNSLWKDRVKSEGGDKIERFITLKDEGNAKHQGNWEKDTHNVLNTDENIIVNWRRASSNFSYNVIEMDMNKGNAQIYNKVQNKYNNTLREIVDEIYDAALSTPTSSADKLSPQGLPAHLSLGTIATSGWTGYSARYNDGSTPGGTYNSGTIASSAANKSRWASYYADHAGDIDDSLLVLLDRACRKLAFDGPAFPEKLPGPTFKFSLYSNDNIIGSLNLLYAKSDDQMGYRVSEHFRYPNFKGVPFVYVDQLDTANASLYGTDPIYGINHELIYPVVLNNWDFKIGKPRSRDEQHVVLTVDIDVVYNYICENRRRAGFLLSEHPSN